MRFLPLVLLIGLFQDATKVENDPIKGAAEIIQPEKIREYLSYLASDELEGRLAGYPGNVKAAEYIAKHIEKLGYKPLGDKNEKGERGWFQKFSPDRQKKLSTQNVIGYFEGTDEKLKSECVIVGAHYDHVGTAKAEHNPGRIGKVENDEIWNGADDNGSGTTTLMEVARALAQLKGKTKRTVIVMWFSAEEWGLLGAAQYVNHPPEEYPLDKSVAMVNLDMVGRNPDKPCSVSGTGTCAEWEKLLDAAKDLSGAKLSYSKGVGGGSDHAVFARKKIPAIHYFSGFHPNYHRSNDHVDLIAFDNAAKIGKSVVHLVAGLANLAERPVWTDPPAPAAGNRPQGKRLGVTLGSDLTDEEAKAAGLADTAGGVRVESVQAGSVAEKAGLKEGDVIVEFAGSKMPRTDGQQAVRDALQKVKDGEPVVLKVLRGKETVELKAVWGEKKPDEAPPEKKE